MSALSHQAVPNPRFSVDSEKDRRFKRSFQQQSSSSTSRERRREEYLIEQTATIQQTFKRSKKDHQPSREHTQTLPPQSIPREIPRPIATGISVETHRPNFFAGLPFWSFPEERNSHINKIHSLQTRLVEFLSLLPSHDVRTHGLPQHGKDAAWEAMYDAITEKLDNKYSNRGVEFHMPCCSSEFTQEINLRQLDAEVDVIFPESSLSEAATPESMEGLGKTAILNQEDYWLCAASIVFVQLKAIFFKRSRTNIVLEELTPELLEAAEKLTTSSHQQAARAIWPPKYQDNGMLRLMAINIKRRISLLLPVAPELINLRTCLGRARELRDLFYQVSGALAPVNGICVSQALYVRVDSLLEQIEIDLQRVIDEAKSINAEVGPQPEPSEQSPAARSRVASEQDHVDGGAGPDQDKEQTSRHKAPASNNQGLTAVAAEPNAAASTEAVPTADTDAVGPLAGPELEAHLSHTDADAFFGGSTESMANYPLLPQSGQFDYLSRNPLEFTLDDIGL